MTRDEILHQALGGADIASLDAHDRPHGSIVEAAYSVGWLQAGLDQAHQSFPWAATLARHSFTINGGTDTYDLPDDFILDYEDGLIVQASDPVAHIRMQKWSLDDLLDAQVAYGPGVTPQPDTPRFYVLHGIGQTIAGRGFCTKLQVWPIPRHTCSAVLTYYKLPNVLKDGAVIPTFPSDYTLIEYVTLCALEWGRQAERGTAVKFMDQVIGRLVQSPGMGREAGRVDIPLDRKVFRSRAGATPTSVPYGSWMGP